MLVSLELELQVSLGQCSPRFCSQEESLVYHQNQVGLVVGGCCREQQILNHIFCELYGSCHQRWLPQKLLPAFAFGLELESVFNDVLVEFSSGWYHEYGPSFSSSTSS